MACHYSATPILVLPSEHELAERSRLELETGRPSSLFGKDPRAAARSDRIAAPHLTHRQSLPALAGRFPRKKGYANLAISFSLRAAPPIRRSIIQTRNIRMPQGRFASTRRFSGALWPACMTAGDQRSTTFLALMPLLSTGCSKPCRPPSSLTSSCRAQVARQEGGSIIYLSADIGRPRSMHGSARLQAKVSSSHCIASPRATRTAWIGGALLALPTPADAPAPACAPHTGGTPRVAAP
jgi:hypothetical protein